LRESIELHNRQRALLGQAYELRREHPELLPIEEAYLLARAAGHMPVEDHIAHLERVLPDIRDRPTKARDNIRILAMGPFCEQPPLELLRVIEEAGCYVVDDELLRAYRWYTAPIPGDGNPLQSLAQSYVDRSHVSSVRYPGGRRGEALVEWVKQARAEGVLFVTAKFCEPALYDYVLYKEFLEKAGIPYMHMEFEEKMSAFESARMQVETFVESILFA
jgi:benzoyl-CoA reductase subunit C